MVNIILCLISVLITATITGVGAVTYGIRKSYIDHSTLKKVCIINGIVAIVLSIALFGNQVPPLNIIVWSAIWYEAVKSVKEKELTLSAVVVALVIIIAIFTGINAYLISNVIGA